MTEMRLFWLRLFVINLLSPRFFSLFLFKLRVAARIDLPLSTFSLATLVLNSLFLELTLLVGERNTVVVEDAILGEEKSYPKPVLLEADF